MGAKVLTGPGALKAWDKVLRCSRAYSKAWLQLQEGVGGLPHLQPYNLEALALAERDLERATIEWAKTQKEWV